MLTQQIIKYLPEAAVYPPNTPKNTRNKPTFRAGSKEHKEAIFKGVLSQAKLSKNCVPFTKVYIKGRKHTPGVVFDIEEDISLIRWEGLKACCVEIYFSDDQEFEFFHPSDIKEYS